MRFEDHCNECEKILGKPYPEVHIFLDQFFKQYGWEHRKILHHTYGIFLVKEFFGIEAAEAAKIHIKQDCNGEIPTIDDWLDADYWLNI